MRSAATAGRVLFALALWAGSGCHAQEYRATLLGLVTDATGGTVEGARITLTGADTGFRAVLHSDYDGSYVIPYLLPGEYRLRAEKTGFRAYEHTAVVLTTSDRAQVDIHLQVATVREGIVVEGVVRPGSSTTVTAESVLVDTGRAAAGRTLDRHTIASLPLFWGNTTDLLRFAPTVFSTGVVAATNGPHALAPGMSTNIAGGVGQNTFSLDGAPNLARSGPSDSTAYQPSEDAVQEAKIETFHFDAATGHTTGIHMALITRSGTNQWHGTAGDRIFQQDWNAKPFFVRQNRARQVAEAEASGDSARASRLRAEPLLPSGHANTFAASIGGPVIVPRVWSGRDRLFFFLATDGIAFRSTEVPNTFNRTVPTLAQRRGDFSDLLAVNSSLYQLYDPLSVQPDPERQGHYRRAPFSGNSLPASRIVNPVLPFYSRLLPTPNNPPLSPAQEPLNNYIASSAPYVHDYRAVTNRVDWQPPGRHRLLVRWNWNSWLGHRADWTYATLPGFTENVQYRNNFGGAANWVYTPGARTVVSLTIADNDHVEGSTPAAAARAIIPSAVGLPAYLDRFAGDLAIAPSMVLTGYDTLGPFNNGYPSLVHTRLQSAQATVSRVAGAHLLRGGFDFRRYIKNQTAGGNTSGNFNFNSAYTQRNDDAFTPAGSLGHSWAAFLLGIPSAAAVVSPAGLSMRSASMGWFVQNDFRATRRLTLNLGFRLEWEGGPSERYNRIAGPFDASAELPLPAKGGVTYPGARGASRTLWRSAWMPMPRLGAAFQVERGTVLRAAYGMFFDSLSAWTLNPSQLGFSASTTSVPSTDFGQQWRMGTNPMLDPFPADASGARFVQPVGSSLGAASAAGLSYSFADPRGLRARQHRWIAGVERHIGAGAMVQVSYAGSLSSRVYSGGGYDDFISVSRSLNALPAEYWASGETRVPATANASALTLQVPNPYAITNYERLRESDPALHRYMASNAFFNRASAPRAQLLTPVPHMAGLTQTLYPAGAVRTAQLDINLQRRFSGGLSLNASYSRLRNRTAATFLNPYQVEPTWQEGPMGRPHCFEATGVLALPFGKGRRLLGSGWGARLAGGYQLSASYEWQPGPLVNFPTNLFYSGKLSGVVNAAPTPDRWFNTAGFVRTASLGPQLYQSRTFPLVVPGVRADMANFWNGNLQREIRLREPVVLQLRAEALNLFNRSQFAAPGTNPYSTSFGTVTATTATYNRLLQLLVRIRF